MPMPSDFDPPKNVWLAKKFWPTDTSDFSRLLDFLTLCKLTITFLFNENFMYNCIFFFSCQDDVSKVGKIPGKVED